MRSSARLFTFLIAAFSIPFASADPLYTFTSANQTFLDQPLTLGFVFSTNTAFDVTSLGWFDATGTGFQSPHTVGIFDQSGTLLVSTTLAAGASGTINGLFRYQSITPFELQAGTAYTLAGTSGGNLDEWTVNDFVNGFSVSSSFTIAPNAARFDYSGGLVFPASHFSDYLVYAGPNLQGNVPVSDVPEPGSLALIGLSAALLFFVSKGQPNRV